MKTAYLTQWFFGILSLFSRFFFKKDRNRVVLTAFHGDGFRGNTKALFLALQTHPTLKPVWLSRNEEVVQDLKHHYGVHAAFLTHSLSGLKLLGEANAIFLTHGTSDYPFMRLPRHAACIQSYHGLPTKRGEYMRPKHEGEPNYLHKLILRYRFNPITHFLSTSPSCTEIFSKRFNIPSSKFIETGYPAYDELIKQKRNPSFFKTLIPDFNQKDSFILYAPTFRRLSNTRWFPFKDQDLNKLGSFLESNNLWMGLRPHPNDRFNFEDIFKSSNRFVLITQEDIEEIEPILIHTDLIITDYSSIFIEGLLRDIPSIFIPYDKDSYERGFPFDYNQMICGPTVFTQQDLAIEIKRSLLNTEYFAKERSATKQFFFTTTEAKATERVLDLLEELSKTS